MNNAVSLQDLMHDMARRATLHDRHEDPHSSAVPKTKANTEIEIYLRTDPLFADLYKQYQDAKQRRQALIKRYDENEPMVDVATDVMDSAESALQTRLIELRQDKKIQIEAMYQTHLLKKEYEQEEAKRHQDYQHRLHDFYARGSLQHQKAQQKEQQAQSDFFLMIMIWLLLQTITQRALRSLQLAHIFMNVSNDHYQQAAA